MLAHHVSALCYPKKSASCESVLKVICNYGHNSSGTVTAGSSSSPIAIREFRKHTVIVRVIVHSSVDHDPQTPRQADYGSSPELDYFRGPQMSISSPPAIHGRQEHPEFRSRYATDFRELEEIGQGGFGKVMKCEHRVDGHVYASKQLYVLCLPQSLTANACQSKRSVSTHRLLTRGARGIRRT